MTASEILPATPITPVLVEDPVVEYKRRREVFAAAVRRVNQLLHDLLRDYGVRIHMIESRTKEVASFEDKLKRRENKYSDPVREMPDLAGLRVIVRSLD